MSDGVLAARPVWPKNNLDTLCEWLAAGGNSYPSPVIELVALNAGEYAEHEGIPIHPPARLEQGERVRLWWFIEAGIIEYHHAATRWREGDVPRRALLTLLAARALVAGGGFEPPTSGL